MNQYFSQISTIRPVFTNRRFVNLFLSFFLCIGLVLPGISQNTYRLSIARDVPVGVAGAGMLGTSFILKAKKDGLTEEQIASLNRNDINRMDRGATYQWSPPMAHASDATLYIGVAIPSLIFIDKKARTEYKAVLTMTAETYLLTAGLTNLTKELSKRERPFVYNDDVPIEKKIEKDAIASFFSGHTSMTAAGSFLTAKMFADFNPDSKWKPMVWTSAAILPAISGLLRFKAGKHYWTDILTGYAVGAVVGVLVPTIHKARDKP